MRSDPGIWQGGASVAMIERGYNRLGGGSQLRSAEVRTLQYAAHLWPLSAPLAHCRAFRRRPPNL